MRKTRGGTTTFAISSIRKLRKFIDVYLYLKRLLPEFVLWLYPGPASLIEYQNETKASAHLTIYCMFYTEKGCVKK